MRENGGKRKEEGTPEKFPPILLMRKKLSLVTVHKSLYTAPAKQNYKNNQNQKLLQGIKWEENQKGNKMSENVKNQDGE